MRVSLTVKLSESDPFFRRFHRRNDAMARKKGCAWRWLLPRLWREGREKEKKKKKKGRRGKKKERGGKKEDTRRFGEERRREEEGSLVHGEIARPLTILRYYARPFLQRSLCSLARANRRPSWNMVSREREREKRRAKKNGLTPLSRSGSIDPINEDQSSDTRKNLTRSHLSRTLTRSMKLSVKLFENYKDRY